DGRVGLPAAGTVAAPRPEADPVRRRRAQQHREGLGRRDRPLGPDVPGRVRGRPAQPGRHDPVRAPQRAAGRPGRADVRGLARPRGPDAGARHPAVHRGRPPPGRRLRRAGPVVRDRARLHQHAHRPGPGRHPAGRGRPGRVAPDRAGRRARGVQPGADRGVPGRGGAGRRRAGGRRDHRRHRRLEGRGVPGRAGRGAAAAGEGRRRLRAPVLRRRLPARRADPAGRAEPPGRAAPGLQAHGDGPGRVAVPEAAAGPAGRVGARADVGGDLPRLHPGLPVLPGRDDHPAGAGAVDHRHRRDGAGGPGRHRLPGGRAAVAVLGRPQRDRRGDQGPGRPVRGHQHLPVAALDPGGRVQRRPGQRAVPQRAALRADLRPGGRLRAAAPRDQQDGVPRGPHPHRHHGVRQRLAAGEALLHVRPADRDRRGRAGDRVHGARGDPGRPGRRRHQGRALHGVDRRVRAQAAHAVPVGGADRARGRRPPAQAAPRGHQRRPVAGPGDRLPLPRRAALDRRGTAVPGRPAGVRGDPAGLGGRRPVRRLERALLVRAVDVGGGGRRCRRRLVHAARARRERGPALGPPGLRAGQGVALDRLAGRPLRAGAGRLPVGALLRLRGLPGDGHRDPDRAHRQDPAAAADRTGGAHPEWL
ncbi:MAG: FIG092679: Fe-S oxidoreductase, partial [uncultured Corynebacteriales bacterium]